MSILRLALLVAVALAPRLASGHCQLPCGIFDDHARIHMLEEDSRTIAKAGSVLRDLAGKTDAVSLNQAVRAVQVKESHAAAIITRVAEYFLAQKVKAPDPADKAAAEAYAKQLAACHRVIVAAMKAKQAADEASVATLDAAIADLAAFYPPAKK